jgi:hypothetical protein
MSVTAAQLSKTGARGKELDAIVREHLTIIDERLLKADRTWGRNVVSYDLPVSFSIPGLDKKSAQRIIYSAILRSLGKRKFEVRILLETDKTTLYIAWMTDLDVGEVEAMNALIRGRRIARDEVQTFMEQSLIAAPRAASGVRTGQAQPAPPMQLGATQIMKPRGGVSSPGAHGPARNGGSPRPLGQPRPPGPPTGAVRGTPAPPDRAELELLSDVGARH